MNNSPINSIINSTTVVELADATSLKVHKGILSSFCETLYCNSVIKVFLNNIRTRTTKVITVSESTARRS